MPGALTGRSVTGRTTRVVTDMQVVHHQLLLKARYSLPAAYTMSNSPVARKEKAWIL